MYRLLVILLLVLATAPVFAKVATIEYIDGSTEVIEDVYGYTRQEWVNIYSGDAEITLLSPYTVKKVTITK